MHPIPGSRESTRIWFRDGHGGLGLLFLGEHQTRCVRVLLLVAGLAEDSAAQKEDKKEKKNFLKNIFPAKCRKPTQISIARQPTRERKLKQTGCPESQPHTDTGTHRGHQKNEEIGKRKRSSNIFWPFFSLECRSVIVTKP